MIDFGKLGGVNCLHLACAAKILFNTLLLRP